MELTGEVAVEALYLLIGTLAGRTDAQRAIRWADDLIRQLDEPPIEIIDLALVSADDRRQLISALANLAYPAGISRELTVSLLVRLGRELTSEALTAKQVTEMLSHLRNHCQALTAWESAKFSIVIDELEISEQYMGQPEKGVQDLADLLARYR